MGDDGAVAAFEAWKLHAVGDNVGLGKVGICVVAICVAPISAGLAIVRAAGGKC